ncbi:MAG: hypothetical protein IPG53_17030 [Ignavibacteriales bacterium]|nr:hypothetical protein [Ignavibacteriales bacterium]
MRALLYAASITSISASLTLVRFYNNSFKIPRWCAVFVVIEETKITRLRTKMGLKYNEIPISDIFL